MDEDGYNYTWSLGLSRFICPRNQDYAPTEGLQESHLRSLARCIRGHKSYRIGYTSTFVLSLRFRLSGPFAAFEAGRSHLLSPSRAPSPGADNNDDDDDR